MQDSIDEQNMHKDEAAVAQDVWKNTTDDAHAEYSSMCSEFDSVLPIVENTDGNDESLTQSEEVLALSDKDVNFIFHLSSDYQQDNHVPTWNQTPQPSTTYAFPTSNKYVHIFCAESSELQLDRLGSTGTLYRSEPSLSGALRLRMIVHLLFLNSA